jgi:HEAT repeat protein
VSLLEALRDADPAVRRAACERAADDPAAALLGDALAERLDDEDVRVARSAARALARISRSAGGPEPALIEALRSRRPGRRIFAAFALAEIEPPGQRILPALLGGLSHPDSGVRWSAARLVVEAGRSHPDVLGILLGLVGAGEAAETRRMAAFALRELAPDVPQAALALLGATRDADPGVRRAALTALSNLMDPPPDVAARLREVAADDPDPTAQRLAARALELVSDHTASTDR